MASFSIHTTHAEMEHLLRKMLKAIHDSPDWEVLESEGKIEIQKKSSGKGIRVNDNLKALLEDIQLSADEFWAEIEASENDGDPGKSYSQDEFMEMIKSGV